jgi:hypothetical protein
MFITITAFIIFLIVSTIVLMTKMFFDKRKGYEDWSAWANVVSAIGTVVVGIVTIVVMKSQDDIQKRQLAMEEAKNQPIFVLSESHNKSEGSDKFDYEEFGVFNYGAMVKSFSEVTPYVFVQLTYCQNNEIKELYAPIDHYYYEYYITKALQGDVAHSYGSSYIHNTLNYVNNIYWGKSNNPSIEWVNSKLIKIFVVSYVDIYGVSKTIYFESESETTKEYVLDIISISQKQFPTQKFDIRKVSIDAIIEASQNH